MAEFTDYRFVRVPPTAHLGERLAWLDEHVGTYQSRLVVERVRDEDIWYYTFIVELDDPDHAFAYRMRWG